jgi:flagellin-like protein
MDRAASSVIGVVLLVAITVLVAATVGTFALAKANQASDPPPEGSFEFDYQKDGDTRQTVPSDNLTVTYTHGESIPAGRINFTFSGAREFNQNGQPEGTNDLYVTTELFGTGTVAAGETETISEDNVQSRSGGTLGSLRALDLAKAEVRVYWVAESGERSFVIAEWQGPEA